MQTALAGLLPECRIQRLAGLRGTHQRLLAGDDGEEHVAHHDRPDDRSDVDECRPTAEQMCERIGHHAEDHDAHQREPVLSQDQARLAHHVVDRIAQDHGSNADRDRRRSRKIRDRGIDHE